MLTKKTKQIGIGIAITITVVVVVSLILPMPWGKSGIESNENRSHTINATISDINLNLQTSIGNIKINAKAPESRTTFPYYRAYYANGDVADKYFGDLEKVRHNLTSVEKAPDLARKAMEPYGGIPLDAYVSISYINGATIGPGTPKEKKLQFNNQVYFHRTIDSIPVTGMQDGIIVWLGDNGELLRYKKFWRTLELMGSVPVIPVDKAIQKLGNREIINPPQSPSDALVTQINLRYYAKSWNAKEIYLEPVWDFYAILPSGNPYEFFVYARQFAGFKQSPVVTTKTVSGKSVREIDPFTAIFTDTSDASPTKWQWDFGDGTTSTEKNPTHTYKTAGTYNVTLTVWNDLGSDTIEKPYTVISVPSTPITANITAMPIVANITETLPTTIVTVNETVSPTITVSPSGGNQGAGDGVNETVTIPVPTGTMIDNSTAESNTTNGS